MNFYIYNNIPVIEQGGIYYNADTREIVDVEGYIEPMSPRMIDRYKNVRITKVETDIEEIN